MKGGAWAGVFGRLQLALTAVVALAGCTTGSLATPSDAPDSAPAAPEGAGLSYPERVDLVVACVEERGFQASSYEGFGVTIEAAGDAQLDAASEVEGDCWDVVDARYPPPPPMSTEDNYYYMVDVAECLRELGYDIPEAPTVEAYVDQMSANTVAGFWDPYATLSRQGVDIWQLQREDCPPYPWAR